jgi:MFS transporter, PAT family, beta-lactamase induction signal transducer AmpG
MATSVGMLPAFPSLSEHRNLRFLTIFLLYIAQGIPLGLFQLALPAWMASNSASAADIGFVLGIGLLPWSMKLVNGFIMDRFAYLPMGRRRPWVISAQAIIIVGLLVLAIRNPGPQDIVALAGLAFAINLAVTFQDVAIDGMAVDLIPDEERGRANGFMFGGQALGMSFGTLIAGFALAQYGIDAAALLIAMFVGMLLTLILILRERPGERLLPWSGGMASEHATSMHAGAWLPIVQGVFAALRNGPSLTFMSATFTAGISLGIFYGLAPLMATSHLGWNEADFASLSGSGSFFGGIAGLLIVGVLADKVGAKRTAILLISLVAALALTMMMLRASWSVPVLLITFVISFLILDTAIRVSTCAVAMRLCTPSVAATQFALYMAAANLGLSAGAASLGVLNELGGHAAMILAILGVNLFGGGLLIVARVGR